MAIGNVFGGRSADKNPDPDRLFRRILIAAIWIAAIPVLGKYIIIGVPGVVILSVNIYYLIWAALAACLVIFVFSLFLLGTVTPSLAKYSVGSSVLYFIRGRSGKKIAAAGIVLFVVCSLFGHSDRFAFWEDDLAFEGESVYNYLQVKEEPDRTIFSTNVLFGVQSVKMKSKDLTGMYSAQSYIRSSDERFIIRNRNFPDYYTRGMRGSYGSYAYHFDA